MKRNLMDELTEGIDALAKIRRHEKILKDIEGILAIALEYPESDEDLTGNKAWGLVYEAAYKIKELKEGIDALAKRREMSNSTTLTKEQIKNLLLNAAAFVDKDGALFTTDKYNIDPYEFRMYNSRQGCVEFSYDNCTFDDGKVTFETHDADTEQFTVLAIVTDIMELIK